MTVWEWICENGYFEEAEMYDINGNEITAWYGADDPKYEALVMRVEPKYPDEPWICAKVYTDYDKGKE